MSPSPPSITVDDDQLVVEAASAEAALEVIAERLGPRARISSVDRVRRGGVAGFFARELIQVTASVGDAAADDAPGSASTRPPDRSDPPVEAAGRPSPAVERVLDDLDDQGTFARALRRSLATTGVDEPGARGPHATAADDRHDGDHDDAPAPGPHDTAPRRPVVAPAAAIANALPTAAAPAPARSGHRPAHRGRPPAGTPVWSVDSLHRVGVGTVLDEAAVAGLDPTDDIGWTTVLARRMVPLCRPLPDVPTVVVGPSAGRLAGVLGLEVCEPGTRVGRDSFIAPIGDSDDERRWLRAVRGGRILHLVVGGPRWRGLLFDEPAVLSWTVDGLGEAVSMAAMLSLQLGYATAYTGRPTPATPIDVAVAIRRLLPTH